ncbi:MAG: ribonuclease HI family protein [Candidatus Micrarchaeota archaeon]|nr:ribonuclease HI family protein [Candidatus Micrarchaeota archaeon]
MLFNIYTDGASRNNPGKSASGYMICDTDGNVLLEKAFYNGIKTNNEAEYMAVLGALEALEEAYSLEGNEVQLYSDSRLMINQLDGRFKVKNQSLGALKKQISEMLQRLDRYSLHNVPRENKFIAMVDGKLNDLLDKY